MSESKSSEEKEETKGNNDEGSDDSPEPSAPTHQTTVAVPAAEAALPLDWTQMGTDGEGGGGPPPIRYPHDVEDWSMDDMDLCIVGTAGQKITNLNPDFSKQCNPQMESLVLRSHLITKMQGLDTFSGMELLELYDNQITALESLEGPGPTLRVLDMSYNVIRDMSPVAVCTNLKELYLANNKLRSMEGLKNLVHLKKVDLGANRIRALDPNELSGLTELEELWIGKNKIEEIQGLETLTKLRRLDLQSNRLTKIENLSTQLETLEELYLSHNGIDDEGAAQPTGLALDLPNLNVLDLSRNCLTSTKPFAHLAGLEELWLSGNQVETFDAILPLRDSAAAGQQSLDTVYLEYNPVASEFEYRKRLKEWIPNLSQIDATMIGGLGMHGMQAAARPLPTVAMTPEQLQQAAIDRAKNETNQAAGGGQSSNAKGLKLESLLPGLIATTGLPATTESKAVNLRSSSESGGGDFDVAKNEAAMTLWRKNNQDACSKLMENNPKDSSEARQQKEDLERKAMSEFQIPASVEDTDNNQMYQQCKNVFIDLGTNIGDSIGYFVDNSLDFCTPIWLEQFPGTRLQQSFPRPRLDVSTLEITHNGKGNNPLYKMLQHETTTHDTSPDTFCVYGMEGNPTFTPRLNRLENHVMNMKPRPVQHLHIHTESVITATDGPTKLYLDKTSVEENFWGSSILSSQQDAQKTAREMGDGQVFSADVLGITLSTLTKNTVLAFKEGATAEEQSGGSLIIKMDVEGAEYQVLKEVAQSNVLCDYIAKGNRIVFIVEYHNMSITDAKERQREKSGHQEAVKKLKECGVEFGSLSAAWH